MSEIAEKVRSLGYLRHKGKARTTQVLAEDTGRVAGEHVEHWDGSQDAVVRPETVKLKVSVKEEP